MLEHGVWNTCCYKSAADNDSIWIQEDIKNMLKPRIKYLKTERLMRYYSEILLPLQVVHVGSIGSQCPRHRFKWTEQESSRTKAHIDYCITILIPKTSFSFYQYNNGKSAFDLVISSLRAETIPTEKDHSINHNQSLKHK